MPVDHKSEMQCAEFDLLLADALDGALSGAQATRFEQHKTACAKCYDLFAETKAGLEFLNTLDEVEPPRHLVHNILVATIGVSEQASVVETEAAPVTSPWQRIWLGMRPVFAPIFTPRFGGSLAMAFFSITMVLNVAGIKFKDLRHMDLSSRSISSKYYAAQTRAIKYYDNIRLVYEFETRVRNLRRCYRRQQRAEPGEKRHAKEE
jgi:hypothetical protein